MATSCVHFNSMLTDKAAIEFFSPGQAALKINQLRLMFMVNYYEPST